MKDIATRLGVSTVTVSKALGGKDGVGDKLREEILVTAEQMGFKKNTSATGMRDGKTHNIGILVSERYGRNDSASLRLQQEMSKQLLANGYYAILEVIDHSYEETGTMAHLLKDNKVDGIIILGQLRPSYVKLLLTEELPTIFVDFSQEQHHLDTVICDNVYGGYVLTNHLLSLGHRNIAFVGNPMYSTVIMDRYLGYYKALMEQGIEFDSDLVIHNTDEMGDAIALTLPRNEETAYVCVSCESAYRLIQQLKTQGIEIPANISIVSFDEDHFTTLSDPPLTTFSVDPTVMGTIAVQTIISRIKDPAGPYARKIITGSLQVRSSSARHSPAGWDTLRRFG